MPMTYKTQCPCQMPGFEKQVNEIFHGDSRSLCKCNGTKEVELDLTLNFPDFTPAMVSNYLSDDMWEDAKSKDELDARITDEELYSVIECSCGDRLYLGGDASVCKCGRVYKLEVNILKDDTHRNDDKYWEKIKKEKYVRYGEENAHNKE